MTSKEWRKLTSEQQRIKIAEFLGFSQFERVRITGRCESELKARIRIVEDSVWCDQIVPDYVNDLNATHELELYIQKVHGSDKWLKYVDILRRNVNCGGAAGEISATASERAEAFVLTLEGEL
jgi:hypothetical protein